MNNDKLLAKKLIVSELGLQPYTDVWQRMKQFTHDRTESTEDELWLLEHPAVFTLGQAGKPEHILDAGDIPVVQSDRGGQVTYHGPGQLVGYLLFDIRRMGLGVRDLVTGIEQSLIAWLHSQDIDAVARKDAPGVYVSGKKVAALGLRVRKGRSYHGFSLNVDVDLSAFERINPCGYAGLQVTDTVSLGIDRCIEEISADLVSIIKREFGYDSTPLNRTSDV